MKSIILVLDADTGGYKARDYHDGSFAIRVERTTYHIEPQEDGSLRIQRDERGGLAILPVINNTISVKPTP